MDGALRGIDSLKSQIEKNIVSGFCRQPVSYFCLHCTAFHPVQYQSVPGCKIAIDIAQTAIPIDILSAIIRKQPEKMDISFSHNIERRGSEDLHTIAKVQTIDNSDMTISRCKKLKRIYHMSRTAYNAKPLTGKV